MPLQFAFEPKPDDYSTAINTFSSTLTRTGLYLVFLLVIGLSLGVQAISSQGLRTRRDWFTPFCLPAVAPLVGVAVIALNPLLQARRIRGQVNGSPQMRSRVTWTMDDTRVMNKTDFAESTANWSIYQRVVEYKDYYLLIHAANRRVFHFIPRRALIDAGIEQDFRALVASRIGPIKDERRLKHVIVPLANGAVVLAAIGIMLLFWAVIAWRMLG